MEDFMNVLLTTLIANCPFDTGNMKTHITFEDLGDYYNIRISGPTANFDYAKAVNENMQRGSKEIKNYHFDLYCY
jgi:hypothetical protein